MVESELLSLNGEAPISSAGAALDGDNALPMSPPTALMSLVTLPGLSGVSAGGGAISTGVFTAAGACLGRGGQAVSAMATAANFCTGGIVRMGVSKTHRFLMDYANEL